MARGGARRRLTVAMGLLCTAIGAGLTVGSWSSPEALAALAAAGLILTGLLRAARSGGAPHARWSAVAGAGCAAAGLALAGWPGVTVRVVAVLAGIALVLYGTAEVADRRLASVVRGTARIVAGVLVLSWPHVTVFGVAVVTGAHVTLAGLAATAGASTAVPAVRRVIAATAAVVVALPLLVAGLWLHAVRPRADAFYTPPADVPAVPGALLRSEAFRGATPAGARAWRILYTTTRGDHTPAVASALILSSTRPPPGPRPVLAWAHGATGIAAACAPSLLHDPLGDGAVPGLDQILRYGWVVVAPDYTGLGTRGPHPFLIGQGEARSVLDAVRAAHHLTAVELGPRTVVWGHSQGGNAALWTGILAAGYAPDAGVSGVAALAPGSDLPALAARWGAESPILGAYLIQAYSDTYPDVRFDTYVRATARIPVHELAGRCLFDSKVYLSGTSALLFGRSIWASDPATGAYGARLRANTPTGPIPMPVLIAQGDTDTTVSPAIQARYVRERCTGGDRIDYRTYPGRDHVGLIAADSPLIPDLLTWTRDRLDGRPARSSCPA